MLVFIDESGDAGFKTDRGSSPVFVAAMAIFASGDDARATQECIAASEARRIQKGEFKFSKTRDDVRDLFFDGVRGCPFKVRAIAVRKDRIYSANLKSDKENFYEFFVKKMLQHDNERLANARVIIDGSGDREFRQRLSAAIKKRVREGAVKDCRFSNSATDSLVQLADMCAGAIARSRRSDRKDALRWYKQLAPKIDDIWDFR